MVIIWKTLIELFWISTIVTKCNMGKNKNFGINKNQRQKKLHANQTTLVKLQMLVFVET